MVLAQLSPSDKENQQTLGVFDTRTFVALLRFQKILGLPQTGVYCRHVQSALRLVLQLIGDEAGVVGLGSLFDHEHQQAVAGEDSWMATARLTVRETVRDMRSPCTFTDNDFSDSTSVFTAPRGPEGQSARDLVMHLRYLMKQFQRKVLTMQQRHELTYQQLQKMWEEKDVDGLWGPAPWRAYLVLSKKGPQVESELKKLNCT